MLRKESELEFGVAIEKLSANDGNLTALRFEIDWEHLQPFSSIQIQQLVVALEHNTNLKSINLAGCGLEKLSNSDFEKLFAALNTHQGIESIICCEITDKQLAIMVPILNKPLKYFELQINENLWGDAVTNLVTVLKNVKLKEFRGRRNASSQIAAKFAEWLKDKDCTLESLDFQSGSISNYGAVALAEALNTNISLKRLNLFNNSIGDEAAMALAKMLKINKTLESLNIGLNDFKCLAGIQFAHALKFNKNLVELLIANVPGIGKAFARMLYKNTTLRKLSLKSCTLGNTNLFLKVIKTNSTLKSLNLGRNEIPFKLTAKYAEALAQNTTLEEFELDSNILKDEIGIDVAAFGLMLRNNTTLKLLNLSSNNIGDKGAIVISEGVKLNSTLAELNLEDNVIGHKGAHAIAAAFKTRPLKRLTLWDNKFKNSGYQALHSLLKYNPALLELDVDIPNNREIDKMNSTEDKNEAYRQKYRDQFFPRTIQDTTGMNLDVCSVIKDYHEFESYTLEPEILSPRSKKKLEAKPNEQDNLESKEEAKYTVPKQQYFLRSTKQKLNAAENKEESCSESKPKKPRIK